MKIRMAGLNIEIHHRYPFVLRQCRDYLADFDAADIIVETSEQDIDEELQHEMVGVTPTRGYAEFIHIYRKIARQLPRFDAFVFHASVVECDGRAYAFSAPSGTGKSTHTALWLKAFGSRARIINGDKPIFRFLDGQLYAFGTPWCGKEKLQINTAAPLAAICFLQRAAENAIAPLPAHQVVQRLFAQVLMPGEKQSTLLFMDLLDRMITTTPIYLLSCNMELEAARVAFDGMNKGE